MNSEELSCCFILPGLKTWLASYAKDLYLEKNLKRVHRSPAQSVATVIELLGTAEQTASVFLFPTT